MSRSPDEDPIVKTIEGKVLDLSVRGGGLDIGLPLADQWAVSSRRSIVTSISVSLFVSKGPPVGAPLETPGDPDAVAVVAAELVLLA